MLTAKEGERAETEALNTGADDYLTKPFRYAVLVARLCALVRRSRAAGQQVVAPAPRSITAGIVEIPQAQRRCYQRGVEVSLTAKEFDILLSLARQPGVVLSKEQLIDEAWDFAAPAAVNVAEVHVSSLRKKLGGALIETVRGSGYRLAEKP